MTVRESPENARAMAVSSQVQTDLLEAAAIVPVTKERIDEAAGRAPLANEA